MESVKNTASSGKINCIFVGAFRPSTGDGGVGGQMYACRTLLQSSLSNYINWLLIDTSSRYSIVSSLPIRIFQAISRVLKLFYFLVFRKVDVVLIFSSYGFSAIEKGIMVLIAKLFGKYTVLSFRSGRMIENIEKSKYFKWFVKKIINNSDVLICQSEYWKQFYKKISEAPDEKFHVVKNWIDVTSYNGNIKQKKSNDTVNIVYMASLSRNKGIYDIITMVDEFRDDFSNTRFVICGGGPELKIIRGKVNLLKLENIVELRGWVTGAEKFEIMNESDIHVLPSYFEGMPNSIIEAMASGKPVVSTKVGAIPEIVVDNNTGFLVDPGDIKGLRSALVKLINNVKLRSIMGKSGREYVLNNHDIKVVWKELYAIINSYTN